MPRFRRCRATGCHRMVQFPHYYCDEHIDQEADYLASRQKWARSHTKTYQHHYNTITRNRDTTKRDQYNFYRTRQWVHLRQTVLDRDHYICRYCGQPNSKTVDHIIPIEFDPALKADEDNLAVVCRNCHKMKTNWEQDYYGTGIDNELKDVEPITDIRTIRRLIHQHSDQSD